MTAGLSPQLPPCTSTEQAVSPVYLQISALRLEPVFDEVLWIVAEAKHEVSLRLQLVNVLDCFMNLCKRRSRFFLNYYLM